MVSVVTCWVDFKRSTWLYDPFFATTLDAVILFFFLVGGRPEGRGQFGSVIVFVVQIWLIPALLSLHFQGFLISLHLI